MTALSRPPFATSGAERSAWQVAVDLKTSSSATCGCSPSARRATACASTLAVGRRPRWPTPIYGGNRTPRWLFSHSSATRHRQAPVPPIARPAAQSTQLDIQSPGSATAALRRKTGRAEDREPFRRYGRRILPSNPSGRAAQGFPVGRHRPGAPPLAVLADPIRWSPAGCSSRPTRPRPPTIAGRLPAELGSSILLQHGSDIHSELFRQDPTCYAGPRAATR